MRAIEIKLSQGAKPGLGGLLPAAKVTREIAAHPRRAGRARTASARPRTRPSRRRRADRLRRAARRRDRPAGRDQVGGRRDRLLGGARRPHVAPPAAARTSSPSTAARAAPAPRRSPSPTTSRCPSSSASRASTATFARAGLAEEVVFVGAGTLGFPDAALFAFALGCDMINVGREAMLVDRLHPGPALPHRPLPHGRGDAVALADARARPGRQVPVASPTTSSTLRAELLALARSCGVPPSGARHARPHRDRRPSATARRRSAEVFGYDADWPLLSPQSRLDARGLASGA